MPRFAANLSMMYTEHPFLDRFRAAAQDGFKAVEFLFPYDFTPAALGTALTDAGLEQALFNAPPGDWAGGERGIASLPGRTDEFKRGIETAVQYAQVLGNRNIHVMAGLVPADADRAAYLDRYEQNLAWACAQTAHHGLTLLIEPINPRDMPGYLLSRQDDAQAIRTRIGATNLKVQFDLYHCQIVEGDLAMTLRRDFDGIGHIQIAGVPDRHEPDNGEVHYPYLFSLCDTLGYSGWIGCEYRPRAGTSEGLGWVKPYLNP